MTEKEKIRIVIELIDIYRESIYGLYKKDEKVSVMSVTQMLKDLKRILSKGFEC